MVKNSNGERVSFSPGTWIALWGAFLSTVALLLAIGGYVVNAVSNANTKLARIEANQEASLRDRTQLREEIRDLRNEVKDLRDRVAVGRP